MAVSWNDIIKVPTKDEFVDKFVSLFRLAGFPVASWHSGSLQKHTVESESSLFSDVSKFIQGTGKGGFIKWAGEVDDAWVDLCGENVFAESRKPATFTQGKWTLTDGGGIGPVTINPGSFWVANADKSLRYVNVDTIPKTLPLSGSVELTLQAESAGTKWNVGNGGLAQILTPQPGFTGATSVQSNGTWITQQGADRESNANYAQRCLDKWSTLGSGSDEAAYRYHATSSSSEITRANVYSPGAGAVRIIIAGDAGPVSAAALSGAATRIESKRPLGVPDVLTLNAIVRAQAIIGTLILAPGRDQAAAIAAAQAAVNAFQRATAIGGKVSRERIIGRLLVDGVEDIELGEPAADLILEKTEVWVPNYALVAG